MAPVLVEEGDNGPASETKDRRRSWKAMSAGTSRVHTKLSELFQTQRLSRRTKRPVAVVDGIKASVNESSVLFHVLSCIAWWMCGGRTSYIVAESRDGYIWGFTRVRVRTDYRPKKKKMACPARGPKQDREIFRGCMSRSPYKPQISSEDRVAVLWKSPTARNPDR